jgi:hypothetical protein
MPNPAGSWILYVRDGCHLCEDAGVLLDEMIGRDAYTSVDIETDDDLLVRYGHRIPVLAVDGNDRLELILTRPDVLALLAER